MLAHVPMQLEGTLDQFPLDELIDLIVSTLVTGTLDVGGDNVIGQVFCRDGRMYHAEARGQTGVDALCWLFVEQNVPFCFTAGITSDAVTLWQNAHVLIAQAQQQAQHWRTVHQHIDDMNWIPMPAGTLTSQQAHDMAASPLLAAVDGQRSIAVIAATLGQVPLEVCLSLCELHQQGLVSFRHAPAAAVAKRAAASK